jgi:hypothetical protein
VSDRQITLARMLNQGPGREILDREAGWTHLRCGKCADRTRTADSPLIGIASVRIPTFEFRTVTAQLLTGDVQSDDAAEPTYETFEELKELGTLVGTRYGRLRPFIKDAPRVDAKALRREIGSQYPDLSANEVECLYRDALGRRRSSESTGRLSFGELDLPIVEGRSTMSCWRCRSTFIVGRRKLSDLATSADGTGMDIYLSQNGMRIGWP